MEEGGLTVLRDAPEDKVANVIIHRTLWPHGTGVLTFDCEFKVISLLSPPVNFHILAYVSCFMK